jgi:hypothetical protein
MADAMLVGDKSIFAIESGITHAYEGSELDTPAISAHGAKEK